MHSHHKRSGRGEITLEWVLLCAGVALLCTAGLGLVSRDSGAGLERVACRLLASVSPTGAGCDGEPIDAKGARAAMTAAARAKRLATPGSAARSFVQSVAHHGDNQQTSAPPVAPTPANEPAGAREFYERFKAVSGTTLSFDALFGNGQAQQVLELGPYAAGQASGVFNVATLYASCREQGVDPATCAERTKRVLLTSFKLTGTLENGKRFSGSGVLFTHDGAYYLATNAHVTVSAAKIVATNGRVFASLFEKRIHPEFYCPLSDGRCNTSVEFEQYIPQDIAVLPVVLEPLPEDRQQELAAAAWDIDDFGDVDGPGGAVLYAFPNGEAAAALGRLKRADRHYVYHVESGYTHLKSQRHLANNNNLLLKQRMPLLHELEGVSGSPQWRPDLSGPLGLNTVAALEHQTIRTNKEGQRVIVASAPLLISSTGTQVREALRLLTGPEGEALATSSLIEHAMPHQGPVGIP